MISVSVTKGELAELKVAIRALEKGIILSKPTTPARYDFILDDGEILLRAQVKYAGSVHKHSSGVAVCGLQRKTKNNIRLYKGSEIDILLVYLPVVDRIVAIPPEIFTDKNSLNIRHEPAKNKQKKNCIMVEDYCW